VAKSAGLDFLPLAWECFDLVIRQRDYFMKAPQALFDFMRQQVLHDRAAELGGYDVSDAGAVRLVN
jgi:molybdate-binding protein